MASRNLSASRITLAALALGTAAASLIFQSEPGLNIALSSLLGVGIVFLLEKHSSVKLAASAKALLLTAAGFGLLFAFRDSSGLQTANFLALLTALGLSLTFARRDAQWQSTASRLLFAPFGYLAKTLYQFIQLLTLHNLQRPSKPGKADAYGRVFLGGVVATPLVLLFGGLFYSADAMFKSRVDQVSALNFDPSTAIEFSILAGFLTIVAGGAIYRFILEPADFLSDTHADFIGPSRYVRANKGKETKLGHIEHTTILSALVALFGIFIAIQFESFFGGAQVVANTTGLTFAEYARSGFFQLTWVAGLALVTIVSLTSVQQERKAAITWLTRALVGLVFLVIASAGMRMKLYTNAFGLTELRLYTSAFMVWIALAFAWLIPTVTAGKPRRFGFGAVLAGFGVIATLNFLNPEALVVRTNLAMENPDYTYIASLSKDAQTAWRTAPGITAKQRADLDHIHAQVHESETQNQTDWRSLNLSEILAR